MLVRFEWVGEAQMSFKSEEKDGNNYATNEQYYTVHKQVNIEYTK